jgi:hypothetical protein
MPPPPLSHGVNGRQAAGHLRRAPCCTSPSACRGPLQVVANGNREYYKRRQHVPDEAGSPEAAAQVAARYRRVLKSVPEPQRPERCFCAHRRALAAGTALAGRLLPTLRPWQGLPSPRRAQELLPVRGRCTTTTSRPYVQMMLRDSTRRSLPACPPACRPRGRRQVPVPGSRPKEGQCAKLVPAERRALPEQQHAAEPDIPRMGRSGLARSNQQRGVVGGALDQQPRSMASCRPAARARRACCRAGGAGWAQACWRIWQPHAQRLTPQPCSLERSFYGAPLSTSCYHSAAATRPAPGTSVPTICVHASVQAAERQVLTYPKLLSHQTCGPPPCLQEVALEAALEPKGRVGPGDVRGNGRAGDLSLRRARPELPEDKPGFFSK